MTPRSLWFTLALVGMAVTTAAAQRVTETVLPRGPDRAIVEITLMSAGAAVTNGPGPIDSTREATC